MNLWIYLISLIIVHLLVLANLQFTAWPEMLSYPYFLNSGFNLYKDIALPYQPLLVLILSYLYKIFGYDVNILKYFTWTVILVSDLLITLISFKILGKKPLALFPLLLYVLIQPVTNGNMLWFDVATVPLILAGLLSYLHFKDFKRFLLLGLFLMLAIYIKQQVGLVFVLVAGYFLIKKQFKNVFLIGLGALIPFVAISIYILNLGILKDYLFWTFEVPLVWYPKFPGYTHWPTKVDMLKSILIFAPAIYLMISSLKKADYFKIIVLLVFLATALTSFPRFEFFRLQPTIAMYALLTIFLIDNAYKKVILLSSILIVVLISSPALLRDRAEGVRFYTNEDIEHVFKIRNITGEKDKVYLLGLNSSYYVFSSRLTSKPWVDNYVWYMEMPSMQKRVIEGFISGDVNFIFWRVPETGKWYDLAVYQPREIVEFIKANYTVVDSYKDIQVWKKKAQLN